MSINIIIKTKNFDLTPSLKDRVHHKVNSLEKFINPREDQEVIAEVDIGLISKHHKKGDKYRAEINLNCDGRQLRSVSKCPDMFVAIDDCCSEMNSRIRRSKTKRFDLMRRGALRAKNLFKGLRRK